jgi:hypothetical protein
VVPTAPDRAIGSDPGLADASACPTPMDSKKNVNSTAPVRILRMNHPPWQPGHHDIRRSIAEG